MVGRGLFLLLLFLFCLFKAKSPFYYNFFFDNFFNLDLVNCPFFPSKEKGLAHFNRQKPKPNK
jgi:hypothetical protein